MQKTTHTLSFVILDTLQNEILRLQAYTNLECQTCVRLLLWLGVKHYLYKKSDFFKCFYEVNYKPISRLRNDLSHRKKDYDKELKDNDLYIIKEGEHHNYFQYSISIPNYIFEIIEEIREEAYQRTKTTNVSRSEVVLRILRLELDDVFDNYDPNFSSDVKRSNTAITKISLNGHINQVLKDLSSEAGVTVNSLIKFIIFNYLVRNEKFIFGEDTDTIYMSNNLRLYKGRLF